MRNLLSGSFGVNSHVLMIRRSILLHLRLKRPDLTNPQVIVSTAPSSKRFLCLKKAAGASGYELIPQGSARGRFVLNEHVCARVEERLKSIPDPKAFIVSGKLDEIRYGGGRFRLLLGQDSPMLGRLHPDSLDIEALRPLWGKPTTVEGMVHFKVNGQPRLIEAHRMSGYTEGDGVFEEMPSVEKSENQALVMAQSGRARSADPIELAGAWPGDESIDELMALLD